MRRSRVITSVILSVVAAGCTTPDVRPEVAAFAAAVSTGNTNLSADLEVEYSNLEASLREAKIEARALVFTTNPSCDLLTVQLDDESELSDHVLRTRGDTCIMDARYQRELDNSDIAKARRNSRALDDYVTGLLLMSATEEPAKIQDAADAFLAALAELGNAQGGARSVNLASQISENRQGTSLLAGQLAKQYQYQILRRSIRSAGPKVDQITRELLAFHERHPTNPLAVAQGNLISTARKMHDLAVPSTPVATYRAAVEAYEAAVATLNEAYQKSPSGRLGAIRETHRALVRRLNNPSNIEDLTNLVSQIEALRQAFEN